MSVVIVDYGMGNLRSVQKAFERNGARATVSQKRKDLERASRLVVPGVGAFDHAIRELKNRGLLEILKEKIAAGTPYLGLCLGLQILFSQSEEGRLKGLGIIPGTVKRFRVALKVPHMGWNTLRIVKKDCPLFRRVAHGEWFYFVHSYFGAPEDPSWVAATAPYGISFCAALWRGNLFATQFHPEKSQAQGLRVIKNFLEYS